MNRRQRADPSVAAFYDVDGTLVQTTIVHYYVYLRKRLLSPIVATVWHCWYTVKCLYFLILDKIDRTKLNVVFYKDYRGLPASQVKKLAPLCYEHVLVPRRLKEGWDSVGEHIKAGHRAVLVTGSLDFLILPLADALGVDAVIAPSLVETDGVFTGQLTGPPIGGEEKAVQIRRFAEGNGIDLAESHSYGDSIADLPMLEAVGFPHAVNPDRALARIARSRGWPIHHWKTTTESAEHIDR